MHFVRRDLIVCACTFKKKVMVTVSDNGDGDNILVFSDQTENITDHPYLGQIRLLTDDSILEIYLENSWRPICSTNSTLSQHAADTACRQLGYTGAALPPRDYPAYVTNTNTIPLHRILSITVIGH